MATHLLDYTSVEGRWTACGRCFPDNKPLPRGVVIDADPYPTSCQPCLCTERLKLARARKRTAERDHIPNVDPA